MKPETPKHTPGPWKFIEARYEDTPQGRMARAAQVEMGVRRIAFMDPNDARLIAAAPDLLAACHAFVNTFTDHAETTRWECDAYEAAGAAIAKAEGK